MSQGVSIEFKDYHGLLCGFLLCPQAPVQPLEWEDVSEVLATGDRAVWLHFNLIDVRARDWITNCDRLPDVAKDLLLAVDPHIQLEIVEDGFMSVIGDLYYEFHADPDSLGLLRIYVDRNLMISVRTKPLKAIDGLRRNLYHGESIESPMDLMVHLLELLNDLFDRVVTDLREAVEDMEDQILKENFYADRHELSRVRRLLAQLRRHLNANRQVLNSRLMHHLPSWCSEIEESELIRNLDRLTAVTQDLDLVQERARLVQEEMASRLQETVNRNLYVLSIVTTVFLPITLITGIFGMNVGGLPWTENSLGFLWSMSLMGLTLTIVFIILKKQQFL